MDFIDHISNYKKLIFGDLRDSEKIIEESLPFIYFSRLGPLFYQRLRMKNLEHLLDEDENAKLMSEYRNILALNVLMDDFSDELNEILQERSIKTVFTKGLALIRYDLYCHGTRPMNDIDILVSDNEFPQAVKELKKEGFKQYKELFPEDHCMNLNREWINIGVHRDLTMGGRYYSLDNNINKQILDSSIIKNGLYVPNPDHMFFHLISHFAYGHGFDGLVQLTDIIRFFHRFNKKLNYSSIKELLKREHMSIGTEIFLSILSENKLIPEEFISEKRTSGFLNDIRRKIIVKSLENNFLGQSTENHYYIPVFMSEKISDSAKLITGSIKRKFFRKRHSHIDSY